MCKHRYMHGILGVGEIADIQSFNANNSGI